MSRIKRSIIFFVQGREEERERKKMREKVDWEKDEIEGHEKYEKIKFNN